MTAADVLPLAFDIPEGLIPIIFVILYTIAQLVGNREPKPQAKRAPRPRPDLPKPGREPGGAKPGKLDDALRREVDDFLRRASGGEQQASRQRQKPSPVKAEQRPPRQPLSQQSRGESTATPPSSEPPARRPILARSEVQPPAPISPAPAPTPVRRSLRDTSVSDHVAEHISSSSESMTEQVAHLGEEVGLADDRLEEHLREKFDHQLGSLRQQRAEPVAVQEVGVLAAEVRKMLSSPAGVRQLIIANEILNRPESRW